MNYFKMVSSLVPMICIIAEELAFNSHTILAKNKHGDLASSVERQEDLWLMVGHG